MWGMYEFCWEEFIRDDLCKFCLEYVRLCQYMSTLNFFHDSTSDRMDKNIIAPSTRSSKMIKIDFY